MKCNVNYLKTSVEHNENKTTATVVFRINLSKAVQYNDAVLDLDEVTKYLANYGGTTIDEKRNQVLDFEMSASATAHGADQFNETTGRSIALSKVQEKAMLFTTNFYIGLYEAIAKQFACLHTYANNAFTNSFKEYLHYERLGGGNPVDLCEDEEELVKNAYYDYMDFHEAKLNGNIRNIKTVVA